MKYNNLIKVIFLGIILIPKLLIAQVDFNKTPDDDLGDIEDKYQEYFFSFGSYAGDANARKGASAFKWGATTKLLIGMGAAHLSASSLDLQYKGNNDLQVNQLYGAYMFTDAQSASSTMNAPLGLKFGSMSGVGAGFDLGFMYEIRPGMKLDLRSFTGCERELQRTYKVKFGASLTDVGFISHDGTRYQMGVTNGIYKISKSCWNLC